ncbi:aminoglycoside 6-adenylyltransferase [Mesobacillus boroniphilus]|nr:aminoglycoside 6-adenylyltransferase [Mesobacillus boroniphilus]
MMNYKDLITRFTNWAKVQETIQAAIVIGSRARTEVPADEWSDLDIILLTDTPEQFIDSEDWLENIHSYSISFLEKTAVGDGIERRVMFNPHLDVDFVILTPEYFSGMLQIKEVQQVFQKGYKVLFDKTDVTNGIIVPEDSAPVQLLPTQTQFDNLVQDFWYHVVWVSKKMLRGEIWVAKECLDSNLKNLVRVMAEWHAVSVLGNSPWHNGRFIENWADARLVSCFSKMFAIYDRNSMFLAMKETMSIFRLLAVEVGESLNYPYPHQADQAAERFLHTYQESIGSVK